VQSKRLDFKKDLSEGRIRPRMSFDKYEGVFLEVVDLESEAVMASVKIHD
jgi:hypothetical protein